MRRQAVHVAADAHLCPACKPTLDGVRCESDAEGLTAMEHAVLTSGEALERPIQ
jgi:hypothetical protein